MDEDTAGIRSRMDGLGTLLWGGGCAGKKVLQEPIYPIESVSSDIFVVS